MHSNQQEKFPKESQKATAITGLIVEFTVLDEQPLLVNKNVAFYSLKNTSVKLLALNCMWLHMCQLKKTEGNFSFTTDIWTCLTGTRYRPIPKVQVEESVLARKKWYRDISSLSLQTLRMFSNENPGWIQMLTSSHALKLCLLVSQARDNTFLTLETFWFQFLIPF